MTDNEQFLGFVKNGRLQLLLPESKAGNVVMLTEMPMQAAIPAEAQEIKIERHEGKAIMVSGRCSGYWIYSAEITDLASPIVTAIVKKIFGV
ncbi:MAG: hypothetical protein LUQ22_07475 [Methanotrichaceae archaeon]|nr:hypothetical protein [Methanotrichaceae archaeon]